MSKEFSTNDLKEMFGITTSILKSYDIPYREDGRNHFYDFKKVLKAWYGSKLKASAIDDDGEAVDHEREEALFAKERRIEKQLKNKVTLGEQAQIEILEESGLQIMGATRARIVSIPLNVKRKLPNIDPKAIRIIEDEIIEAGNDIASFRLDWDSIEH